jgi:hypothetical protein
MKRDALKELLLDDFGKLDDKQLMSLVIYGEARGEGRAGAIAVGSVILERVEHRNWDGDTIKEVCLMPYQFSCLLPDDPNYIALKITAKNFEAQRLRSQALMICYDIASGLIAGTIPRTPEIAEHHVCQYCTSAVEPDWKSKMTLVATVGHHEFFA